MRIQMPLLQPAMNGEPLMNMRLIPDSFKEPASLNFTDRATRTDSRRQTKQKFNGKAKTESGNQTGQAKSALGPSELELALRPLDFRLPG
jgi:hypothetical protein